MCIPKRIIATEKRGMFTAGPFTRFGLQTLTASLRAIGTVIEQGFPRKMVLHTLPSTRTEGTGTVSSVSLF